jgi:hypothetical protein
MHFQTSRRDLGDIEHLVHEVAQMCRGGCDTVDGWYLSRCEITIETVAEELDEANDRIERSPQLM